MDRSTACPEINPLLHVSVFAGGQAGFRAALMAALAQPDSFAIVNFDRAVLKVGLAGLPFL